MSIKIESTTDTPEQVTAATGSKESVENKSSAPEIETSSETPEASETLEKPEEENDSSDATESDEESEESDEEKPKKKSGFTKRIDKLNKRLSQKEQEIEHWRREALKQAAPEPVKTAPETVAPTAGKPDANAYESHEDYIEALTDWKLDQKLQEKESREIQAKLKSEIEAQVTTHTQRVETFKAQHDDFDDVIESVDDVRMPTAVQEVILASELGPQLMYELAKNKKEFARICALSPTLAARELGIFEAKLSPSTGAKTTEAKKTKAPPPINPISARGAAVNKPLSQIDNYEEFKRAREEQLRRR
jgi:hypothetical protein